MALKSLNADLNMLPSFRYFQALNLTQDHMRGMWNAGYIEGFISKLHACNVLMAFQKTGMFLLRFADSRCGKQ